jgi:hypothetical protein
MKPAKRRRNPPRRPDDTGNTANKRPKAADRRPKQNQAGPSRDSHDASDSHISHTDAGQNIRQNTDTTHPADPDYNVRASNIDIYKLVHYNDSLQSADQFQSHAPQQSGQQRCEESTPSHSAVSIQIGQHSEETVINQRTGSDQIHTGTFNAQGSQISEFPIMVGSFTPSQGSLQVEQSP